ncbi:CapK protein, putative [Photobacterium marinum]|uniref:CapK protein, putative n=1 Tax=Photobacterium marinum TaxID=1056511 RepID=L8J8B4_9GAMM|nr:phenylacetate--CoA ligase family protein [Photobacterium marinum]ELR63769.1 CapK protein, putative [Photobacterium marinum]
MKLLNKIIDPLLVLSGLLYFRFYLAKNAYQDKGKLKEKQFRKFRNLVITSYREIPFYKGYYDSCGFDPNVDLVTIEDVKKVPILSKSLARQESQNLINKKRSFFSLVFKTSGSTGNPFTALVSYKHWIVEQACIWRHWHWAGYRFRDKMAIVRSYCPKPGESRIKYDKLRNFIYFSPFHMSDDDISYYLNEMVRYDVKFLRGYPSSVKILSDFLIRNPTHPKPNLKAVLTASEYLSPSDSELISDVFGCVVSNHYGLAEQIVMFGSCCNCKGMHNYDEYGLLELEPTETDNEYQIIGTNLNNYAMPLIRYATGDVAIVTDKQSCSMSLPYLTNVIGRLDSVLESSKGCKIPVTNFYTVLEHYNFIGKWQIQQRNDNICLVIRKKIEPSESDLNSINEEFKKRLGDNFAFYVVTDGRFVSVGEGKINPFIKI